MVNKVILIGHIGADPETKYLEGEKVVSTFRLATTESYKSKTGEKIGQTEWHNIVVWNKSAEFVEKYAKKGMKLYIEGRLRTRSWDDSSGTKKYMTEILADGLQILSSQRENSVNHIIPETPEQENHQNLNSAPY